MPLESLSNEQFNIHDLTLDQEKKLFTSRELMLQLKDQFYDEKKGLWRTLFGTYDSEDQFYAIIAESYYDQNKANESLEKLKRTKLYRPQESKFNESLDKKGNIDYDNTSVDTELVYLWLMSKIDFQKSKLEFNKLKDSARAGKIRYMSDDLSRPNLGYVFTESLFDKKTAEKEYESLKHSKLYDPIHKQWLMNSSSKIRTPHAELYGVLCEARFNPQSAKELYLNLKKTLLYNKEDHTWNWRMYEDQTVKSGSIINTREQLLGLLCEQEFEESELGLQSPTPELPETRKY